MYQKIFYSFMTIVPNSPNTQNKPDNQKNKGVNILPR